MMGRTLAHFRILEKIGEGGMGEVYLAEDTKLGRRVALKFLPLELAGSDDHRARFQREARAVAAINHPNIVTVHSVEKDGETHFITMELVKGKTLSQLIPKNGFPLKQFFEIAIPIADAVSAAHERGIIHRDLKPANVMLTDDGRVKVLDFGLARPEAVEGPDEEAHTLSRTREGALLGTPAYMSPEQARGEAADARTDIFSLGTLLYQMASGKHPFPGKSPGDRIASILKETPAPLSGVPRALSRIVSLCLEKELDARLQSALDLRNLLRAAARDAEELPANSTRTRTNAQAFVAIGILALVAGYAFRGLFGSAPGESVPLLSNPVQITVAEGLEDFPSWSPDGRTVAYHSNADGDFDIWLQPIGSGEALNRTAGYAGADRLPSWSPDGSEIAFWSEREGGGYFIMPALAGSPRKIGAGEGYGPPRWSRDGTEVGFLAFDGSVSLFRVISVESGTTKEVRLQATRPPTMSAAWHPNRELVAYLDTNSFMSSRHALKVANLEEGREFFVTDGTTAVWSPSWSGDGYLYYVDNRGGVPDLWRRAISDVGEPHGEAQSLTMGLGFRSIDLSTDGGKLVYAKGRRVNSIWRVPASLNRLATWDDAERLTFDQALSDFIDVSPDGSVLFFDSDRAGNPDLWMMTLATGELKQLTSHPAQDWAPRLSPDRQEVAFYSTRSGNRDVWIAPFDGPARRLTDYEGLDCCPAWSPSGDELAYMSNRPTYVISRVSREGNETRHIHKTATTEGVVEWSPRGDFLTFHEGGRLWQIPADGGTPRALTRGPELDWQHRWSLDGRHIYYQGARERVGNIWRYRIEDGVEEPVTELSGRRGSLGQLALAVDDGYVYFTWEDDLGDIWTMDLGINEDE